MKNNKPKSNVSKHMDRPSKLDAVNNGVFKIQGFWARMGIKIGA